MPNINTNEYEVIGDNANALFSLKVHRGEGMVLLAMNWKKSKPPMDFIGFSIEYKEPGGNKFYAVKNRLSFPDSKGKVNQMKISSLLAPIQKFRWIHFPRNAELEGDFIYKVMPVFMNSADELSYGDAQQAVIKLNRETYSNKLNVTFTRGFVSSQAFVNNYNDGGGIPALLPAKSDEGLDFKPTHPKAIEALSWMGFEARSIILKLLDDAVSDKKAEVRVVAYDLNEPEIVERLEKLGKRLWVIIDDSGTHGSDTSAESTAETRLSKSTTGQVKRHHMSQLQHNKTIVVDGPNIKAAICGSTNFTWRGLYVQANNAVLVYGSKAIKPFIEAFKNYWEFDSVKDFGKTDSAIWSNLPISDLDLKISFSPHSTDNALLQEIADDIENKTKSSLFYSLAFLYQTSGAIRNAITKITENKNLFVYGISDKKVGGIDLQKPDGNIAPVYPSEISKNLPEPYKSEPTGGSGTRLHHKFIVLDFNKPTARVYLGSYNFSPTADTKNGENLLLIRDRKIAVSYMIEALRIFDHYHFRVAIKEAKKSKTFLALSKPPKGINEKAWWEEYYRDKRKILDRELFA